MPAKQGGTVFKNAGRAWAIRYFDAEGIRRSKGGFETKTEARNALKAKLEEIEQPERRDLTVQELVDEFLEQYDREPGSVATLTANLKHVTAKFGERANRPPADLGVEGVAEATLAGYALARDQGVPAGPELRGRVRLRDRERRPQDRQPGAAPGAGRDLQPGGSRRDRRRARLAVAADRGRHRPAPGRVARARAARRRQGARASCTSAASTSAAPSTSAARRRTACRESFRCVPACSMRSRSCRCGSTRRSSSPASAAAT